LSNAKKTTRQQRIINGLKERDGFSSRLIDTTPKQYLRRWIITNPGSLENSLYDKVEEQMGRLQERIQELEKSQSELLDRLNEKIEKLKNPDKDEPML
jgi:stalled ribosome rescue protein Dom34